MNMESMQSLIGKVLRIDRGGAESRVGKLIGVGEDHFTFLTKEDGIMYYKNYHIKSITENTKNGLKFDLEIPEGFEWKSGSNFKEVLGALKYQWVKINRGGKESVEGVMDDVNDDFITIISNEEVIRIAMFHIRNVSYGAKIEPEKQDKQASEEDNNKKNNQKSSSKETEETKSE